MPVNDMEIGQKFGYIVFGEIDNYCIDEFDEYLNDYREFYDFLTEFGEIEFGEINNYELDKFGYALTNNW